MTDPSANGTKLVPLGLKETIRLPLMIPQAVNGKDIVVFPDKTRPPMPGVITLYGRDDMVQERVKWAIMENYPGAFPDEAFD